MKPSLYQYEQSETGVTLFFNEISTAEGLTAINATDTIKLTSIGATLYKNYGYATEKDFPLFDTADKLIAFLNTAGDIGLIDVEIEIVGKGKMMTHDDGECLFKLNSKKDAFEILKKIVPKSQLKFIQTVLLKNNGIYFSIDDNNHITSFATFDDYVIQSSHKNLKK